MSEKEKLEKLRDDIEAISHDIITLLEHRARMVKQIGEVKKTLSLTPYDPAREQLLLERLQNRSTLPPQQIEDVFTVIFGSSVNMQAA